MEDRNSANIQTNTPTVDAVHHNILKQSLNMITSKKLQTELQKQAVVLMLFRCAYLAFSILHLRGNILMTELKCVVSVSSTSAGMSFPAPLKSDVAPMAGIWSHQHQLSCCSSCLKDKHGIVIPFQLSKPGQILSVQGFVSCGHNLFHVDTIVPMNTSCCSFPSKF